MEELKEEEVKELEEKKEEEIFVVNGDGGEEFKFEEVV